MLKQEKCPHGSRDEISPTPSNSKFTPYIKISHAINAISPVLHVGLSSIPSSKIKII
jgi:hypothetical protein